MNPKCHRCNKTVYPVEKLNCLDKMWHKGCFNCETCHMTLSMKTYKGYNKLPYCNTHYPSTKFTAVADTPENLRLKKNTTNQSSVVYHKDFESDKGKFTAVADDPETLRTKKTQQQASQLAYQQKVAGGAGESSEAPSTRYDDAPRRQSSGTTSYQAPPPPAPEPEPEPEPVAAPPSSSGAGRYTCLYDYTAADDDEEKGTLKGNVDVKNQVSFMEGDIIINGEPIDEGWMNGTVERTGETGNVIVVSHKQTVLSKDGDVKIQHTRYG